MTFKPLTAKELRERNARIKAEGLEILLPSGLQARVRNVPISGFFEHGGIPDSLLPLVEETVLGNSTSKREKAKLTDLWKSREAMYNIVTRLALVSPRVVDAPDNEDEISVDDLDLEDKEVLVELLNMPAHRLATFCEEQTRTVASLLAGTPLPDTAK